MLLALTGGMLAPTAALTSHRDTGAGLLPPRAGPASAAPRPGIPAGLAGSVVVGWLGTVLDLPGWVVEMCRTRI
jgi:hypothetical protein